MLNIFTKVSFLVHNKKSYLFNNHKNILIVNVLQLISCGCEYIL